MRTNRELESVLSDAALQRAAVDEARAAADAAVSALSSHLEEQSAAVDGDVDRLRMRTNRELESVLSDAALQRAAVDEARAAADAAVSALSSHLEEQSAAVDGDVDRLRMRTNRELESVLSDAALQRAAVDEGTRGG